MNQEIIDFYTDNKIPLEKIISVGANRFGLKPEFIERAASEVYFAIISGDLQIKPIRYAWEIWARAKTKKAEYAEKENQEIKALKKKIKFYEQPFYKRWFRSAP
jgi:hypothetical protein